MNSNEILRLAVQRAAEDFDDMQDCCCEDGDGYCWYYMTDAEQMDERVKWVARHLEIEQASVRQVLEGQ